MHLEYLEIVEEEPYFPEGSWFIDAGITPERKWWLVPTTEFFQTWFSDNQLATLLAKLGFRSAFDGFKVGARCEFIFYCPPNLHLEVECK